jgi:hypothetical protein
VVRQIQHRVDVGNSDALRAIGNFRNFISSAYLTFLENPEIKAGPVMRDEQSGHLGFVHSKANAIAGHAGLRHLEESGANPIAIANAYLVVSQSVYGEVFAELPKAEIVAAEVSLPVTIGVQLIHHNGTMLASVSGEIALSVAVYIQLPGHPPALHRLLPNAGMDSLSAPCDVTREAYID